MNDQICDFLEDITRGAIRLAVVLGVVVACIVFGLGVVAGAMLT